MCVCVCVAISLATGKKKFFFRGCGWSNKAVVWSKEDALWITAMNQLFDSMYRKDALKYLIQRTKGQLFKSLTTPETCTSTITTCGQLIMKPAV